MDAVARHLGPAGGAILDLGSGTGRFSSALATRFGVPVVALEPADGMREQARPAGSRGRVAMVAGRGEAVPARDGAFVAVWASQVLHHVDDLSLAERGDPVLELRQLLGHLRRDQVWTCREDLSQLRERRAELLEGPA